MLESNQRILKEAQAELSGIKKEQLKNKEKDQQRFVHELYEFAERVLADEEDIVSMHQNCIEDM